ncbi:MAG: hypothetical protein M5T52_24475 [Ignavibacteriaceae bacterium]|nr:hypothetical protein [Ignavibacteriaceae bacterium]
MVQQHMLYLILSPIMRNVDDDEDNYLFRRNAINRNQRLAGMAQKFSH